MKLDTLQTTDLLKIARFNKGEKRRQALEQMTDEQLQQALKLAQNSIDELLELQKNHI